MSRPSQEDDRPDRALWKRFRDAADGRPASPCPDPNAFGAYVDGRASPDEVRVLEEHLSACADCRELLAEVHDGLNADPPAVSPEMTARARAVVPGTGRGRGLLRQAAWWAAAAAVVAAVSFVGYQLGSDTPGLEPLRSPLSEEALSVDPLSFRGPGI